MTSVAKTAPAAVLAELLEGIAGDLGRVESWISAQLEPEHARLQPLLRHAGRFRGKRVRAAHVLLVGQACGRVAPEHRQVAGIIELIHAATLIHDDLLDDAQQRRGLDCLHVEWGSHASVLLGDWIYARAFLRSTELADGACSRVLAEATAAVCRGEIHQNLTRGDFQLAEADYYAQIDGKTAALYQAGGRLAAHYAGAGEAVAAACARHGLLAGRAFQIVDDVLDLVGEEQRVRKSLGTDWERRKMTLPLIRLRAQCAPPARARLEALFQGEAARSQLLDGEFGAPLQACAASCRAEAAGLLEQAIAALAPLPDSPARRALAELTRFLGSREQ